MYRHADPTQAEVAKKVRALVRKLNLPDNTAHSALSSQRDIETVELAGSDEIMQLITDIKELKAAESTQPNSNALPARESDTSLERSSDQISALQNKLHEKLKQLCAHIMFSHQQHLPLIGLLLQHHPSVFHQNITAETLEKSDILRFNFCGMIAAAVLKNTIEHLNKIFTLANKAWQHKLSPKHIDIILDASRQPTKQPLANVNATVAQPSPDVAAAPQATTSAESPAPADETTLLIQSIIKEIQTYETETKDETLDFFSALKSHFHTQDTEHTFSLMKEKIKTYLDKIRFTQLNEMMLGGIKSATHASTYLATLEGVSLNAENEETKNKCIITLANELGLNEIILESLNALDALLSESKNKDVLEKVIRQQLSSTKTNYQTKSTAVKQYETLLESAGSEQEKILLLKTKRIITNLKVTDLPAKYASLKALSEDDWLTYIANKISPHDRLTSNERQSFIEHAYESAFLKTFYLLFCDRTEDSPELPHRRNSLGSLQTQLEEFSQRYKKLSAEYNSRGIGFFFKSKYLCLMTRREECDQYRRALAQLHEDNNMFLLLVNISCIYQKRKLSPFLTDLHDTINAWLKQATSTFTEAQKKLFKHKLERELRKGVKMDLTQWSSANASSVNASGDNTPLAEENRRLQYKLREDKKEIASLRSQVLKFEEIMQRRKTITKTEKETQTDELPRTKTSRLYAPPLAATSSSSDEEIDPIAIRRPLPIARSNKNA